MSTVVFQGLQSFLDPQLVETRTLRLKLASPKPSFFESMELALDKETPYVHPMSKQFSPILSYKNLELCTENLGSETGTDMTDNTAFSLSSPASEERETPVKTPLRTESRRVKNPGNSNFPPPLTTIRGSSSVLVEARREGGRLVIKAVEATSAGSCLQAERSHGRLRLSLWKDCFDPSEESTDDIEEFENEANLEEKEDEGCEEEEIESEGGDMEGNSLEVGVEMGMEKFHQRPSRCKEGGHGNEGLCHWEPFWVAT